MIFEFRIQYHHALPRNLVDRVEADSARRCRAACAGNSVPPRRHGDGVQSGIYLNTFVCVPDRRSNAERISKRSMVRSHVIAENISTAMAAGQIEAADKNGYEPIDWAVVFMCEGHVKRTSTMNPIRLDRCRLRLGVADHRGLRLACADHGGGPDHTSAAMMPARRRSTSLYSQVSAMRNIRWQHFQHNRMPLGTLSRRRSPTSTHAVTGRPILSSGCVAHTSASETPLCLAEWRVRALAREHH